MRDFYSNLNKNKLIQRVLSTMLTVCLIVSSITPMNVFAGSNGAGGPASYGGGSGAGGDYSIADTQGGYRFSLLFLSGEVRGGSILDSVGNVSIDEWENYKDDVQIVGSLDVYYPGKDPDYAWSYGDPNQDGISGYFLFDAKGYSRNSKNLQPTQRNKASSAELGLSDFPWKFNCDIGTADNINQILVNPIEGEKVNLELFPNNPEGQRIVPSQKYELTEDCARIIEELCRQSGLSEEDYVYCETARGEDSSKKNVFEQGTYNGATGSYRLMIEPYMIVKTSGFRAMTLRDCIWYYNNVDDGQSEGDFAWNLGNYLSLLTNLAFMEYKDIMRLNSSFYFEAGKNLEDYSNKLKAIDYRNLSGSVTKFVRNAMKMTVEDEKAYGIASVSTEMVGTPPHDMFLGSVTNVFLPGTVMDGGTLNTETKSYSMEYRGEQSDETLQYLDDITKLLVDAINEGTEPANLAGTKAAITANNTNSLFASGTLDDGAYKALTDSISAQIDTSQIRLWNNDSKIKELAKNLITNDNFKDFITQTYFQNVFGTEYAILAEKNLQQNALTDWCKMLVLQTMLETGESNTTIANDDTAIAIMPSDLDSSNRHIGIKILNNDD